jgi:hypothetical protein
VFLYKFGKKIFDKVMSAMQPEFEDEDPINPFDFWAGADFKIKIKKVAGYWNYDSSEFARAGTLGDLDDSELEEIWKKEYSLAELTAAEQFKSYDDLKKRLDYVLGNTPSRRMDAEVENEDDDRGSYDTRGSYSPDFGSRSKPVPQDLKDELSSLSSSSSTDDEDDAMSYFQKLAEF